MGEDVNASCTDAIDACKDSLRKVEGLYIMEDNSVYRVANLMNHKGVKWRSDSLAVMCNPRFRNTLLREVLRETTQVGGQPALNLSDPQLEEAIRSHPEGPAGHACATSRDGFGGVSLALPRTLIDSLARHVAARLQQKPAETALGNELVVNVRLGDWRFVWNETVDAVKRAASQAGGITRIVFSAVLNYGGYNGFIALKSSITKSVNLMRKLVQHFEQENFTVVLRSEPSADRDLEYLATAPNLAIGGNGFSKLVVEIRKRVLSMVRKSKRAGGYRTWIDESLDGEPVVH